MGLGIRALGDTREYRLGAKDGLACALSVIATDETLPELITSLKTRLMAKAASCYCRR